jgi:hypothetical protein
VTPNPKTPADPPARRDGPKRRRVGQALRLWGVVTLGGLVVLAALTLAYLVRRGRRLREQLGPARRVAWPEVPEPERPAP